MVFTLEEILEKSRQSANGVNFEDALKETQFGKFHILLIFISGIFMASAFFETMGVNYILPVAECDLNIKTKQEYGIISGIWFAGIILTALFWGSISDMYGRKTILIITSLSAFTASILSSLAVNLFQLACFRFLNGSFISGATSVIFAYLGEFLGEKNRSRSMMAASVVFGAFCVCLPIFAWLIINQKWSFVIPILNVNYRPWRLFLIVAGLPSFVCGIVLIFFPESPKFTFSQGDELKTLDIFRKMFYFNTGNINYPVYRIKPNEEFGKALERKNVGQMMLNQLVSLLRDYPRSIAITSLLQFGIFFVCNGMLLFFPDILNQTANYQKNSTANSSDNMCKIVESAIENKKNRLEQNDEICVEELDTSAFYYAIILECCYAFGFLIISFLVNYIGRLSIFSFLFFSTGISGILISIIANPTVSTFLYVWLLVSGMNVYLMNTVTYDLFPTTLRSLAMSISLMFGRLGSLVGGNVAGFLLDSNCGPMFVLSGMVMFACGVLTFFIPDIMKKK